MDTFIKAIVGMFIGTIVGALGGAISGLFYLDLGVSLVFGIFGLIFGAVGG